MSLGLYSDRYSSMDNVKRTTIVDRDTARRALSYLEGVFPEKEIAQGLLAKPEQVLNQNGSESSDSSRN